MNRKSFRACLLANLLLVLLVFAPVPAMASDKELKIVALGDSLTASYGLSPGEGFVAQLQVALDSRGHKVTIINAGVSGDTASGGLARLDWSVPEDADAVIVELGANDALRGLDPEITRKALDEIVGRLMARDQLVLLAGMRAPPNLGDHYASQFNPIYGEIAEKHGIDLYPFFLEGVAGVPSLNLRDGIHPTAEGISIIVEKILPQVEQLIRAVGES